MPIERQESERECPAPEPSAPPRAWQRWFRLAWLSRITFWGVALVQVASGAFALLAIGTYLYVAFSRVGFPFDLEWMEGSVVDHVRRVLEHRGIYVQPSLEFTPYIYNPVYYYVSAAAAWIFGLDYSTLRAVSIAASIASMVLIFATCEKETASRLCGVIGAGFFAATYKLSNAWFDVARVDSLAVAFCLSTMYLVRFGQRPRTLVLAGVLAALTIGTKQSLVPIIPLFIGYLLIFENWRKALWFGVTSIALSALSMAVLQQSSGGWYLKYTFAFPRGHALGFITPQDWQIETAGTLIFTLAFAVFFLLGGSSFKKKAFYGAFGAALIWISYYSRSHSLSHVNVNIPAHVALALLAGLGLRPFFEQRSLSAALASVAVLVQFEILKYPPMDFIPSEVDRIGAQKLAESIRSFDGEVYLPQHGFIASREGKGAFAHDIAVFDVERTTAAGPRTSGLVRASVARAVRDRRFAAIILDYDSQGNLPGLDANYRRIGLDLGDPNALFTRTGYRVRPSMVYVRRRPPAER